MQFLSSESAENVQQFLKPTDHAALNPVLRTCDDEPFATGSNFTGDANRNRMPYLDIISGRPLSEISEEENFERSTELFEQWENMNKNPDDPMRLQRESLPAFSERSEREVPEFVCFSSSVHFRDRILETLSCNQVTLVCGDTGSGKTTQVPQYLLEEASSKMCGADCNVIVTQVSKWRLCLLVTSRYAN